MGITVKDVMEKNVIQRLFKQHYAKMYRVARTILYDEQESEDVVSDIFENLLRRQTVLMPDTEERYLLTSVRNRCVNLLVHRQKELQMQKTVVVEMITPEQTAEEEQLQMLHRYIDAQLPKLSQQVLRLRYQQGLKYREIADVLQVSEVTVHNHLSQSLKQLKDHFKSLGYGIK